MCSLFVLFCCSDKNTLRPCSTDAICASHRFPPPAAPQDPMVALPFQRQWWRSNSGACKRRSLHPTPYHQRPIQSIRPIQPVSNQPAHKSQLILVKPRLISIRSRRYDTIHPIQSSQYDQANTIRPIRSSHSLLWREPPNNTKPTQLPQLLIFHPLQRSLPSEFFSLPLLLHILMPSLLQKEIAPSPRTIFWPF